MCIEVLSLFVVVFVCWKELVRHAGIRGEDAGMYGCYWLTDDKSVAHVRVKVLGMLFHCLPVYWSLMLSSARGPHFDLTH